MKKFFIVAGSPNSGKTLSINLVNPKLLNNGYIKTSNCKKNMVELQKDDKKVLLIPNGDYVKDLNLVFSQINFDDYYAIVCSSHATRGKQVFNYLHNLIGKFNLSETEIIPIFKNLLCNHNKNNQENEMVANLIASLI